MDDAIASIVRTDLGASPERVHHLDEGLAHETYTLRCDGDEYVLQFAGDHEAAALERGLQCYVLLQDSGIPVPRVVTEEVRAFEDRAYVLVERLPGKTAERDVSPERVRDAGRYLARIHDVRRFDAAGWIQFDDHGISVTPFEEGGPTQWVQRRVARRAEMLRTGGMVAAGEAVERVFDRVGDAFPDAFRPVLCHNDFSPDNVLFVGDEVTGIIDFDYAFASHDQRDLVKAANGFWMHDPTADWDPRERFYEGYRDEADLAASFERNEPLYRAETHAGTVASLLEMGELTADEQEFYAETILAALERIGEP